MIKKIKYNRELMDNKNRLKRQLEMIKQEIQKEQDSCSHIPAKLYYDEICCIICGKELPEEIDYIDATSDKVLKCDESYSEYLNNYMTYLQGKAMLLIDENPNISKDKLFEKLKISVNEDQHHKQKIKRS